MSEVFQDLYFDFGIPTLSAEQIQKLLFLEHKILEDNDNYSLYLIKNDSQFMFFPEFNILHIKNDNFDFREHAFDLVFSLETRRRNLKNGYYIYQNRNPENVIKKLAMEKPDIGIPLLKSYSQSIINKLNFDTNELKKFINHIDLIYTHLQENNVKIEQYNIDKEKLIHLNEEECEKYIDSLNIPMLKEFPQYCGLKLFPFLTKNDFCLIDYSANMLFKIVKNEENYKIYAINLNYPFIEISEDKHDLVFQFLFLTGQTYHLIQEHITEAHLIFESQDHELKFVTPYIRSFEINQGVLIKDIFNKED